MTLSRTLVVLSRGISVIVGVILVAALHFGQDVFIPLALASMFCFVLSPVVNRLESWRLGRVPAVLITTAAGFAIVGAFAYIAAGQILDLAYKLPSYEQNIRAKIASLQVREDGPWSRVTKTFVELRKEWATGTAIDPKPRTEPGRAERPAPPVVAAPVAEPAASAGTGLGDFARDAGAVALGPIGTGLIVIVFVIFMLLKKEDLRNRLIHLAGRSRLSLTTRTLEEAGNRVSSYLLMQLIVNVSYGIPIGLGLMFLGVPNGLLWGGLTAVLRFIPYIGPWIGALPPVVLSLAVSDSWNLPLLTISLFVVVELISNNVIEPWLYGSSTGLSPVAILLAAIFWTWLWGAVGLLLATPLTVCLAVLGKNVPSLSFLDVLLGDEPSLPSPDRYYQRLLARDEVEAAKVSGEFQQTRNFDAVLAELLAPAVMSAEAEFESGTLSAEGYAYVLATVRKHALAQPAPEAPGADSSERPDVLIIPAEDEGDEVIGIILGELLGPTIRTRVSPYAVLTNEKAKQAMDSGAPVLCISDTSRQDAPRARFLGRRLRSLQNSAFVVTGLWSLDDEESNLAALAERFCADQASTNLLVARDELRRWVKQSAALAPVSP